MPSRLPSPSLSVAPRATHTATATASTVSHASGLPICPRVPLPACPCPDQPPHARVHAHRRAAVSNPPVRRAPRASTATPRPLPVTPARTRAHPRAPSPPRRLANTNGSDDGRPPGVLESWMRCGAMRCGACAACTLRTTPHATPSHVDVLNRRARSRGLRGAEGRRARTWTDTRRTDGRT